VRDGRLCVTNLGEKKANVKRIAETLSMKRLISHVDYLRLAHQPEATAITFRQAGTDPLGAHPDYFLIANHSGTSP
jgi:hypothetical protein